MERTVRKMPLWKLQTIGSERLEFLYAHREDENPPEIELKPGVAYCFRQFYSLITDMAQGAWTLHIRRTNEELLHRGGERELRSFLFGTLPLRPRPQLRPRPRHLQRPQRRGSWCR